MVPVSEVDRAKEFYTEKLGFNVDVDHQPNDEFRVVQLTPPGSACSISMVKGPGTPDMKPGSLQGLQITTSDLRAVHKELTERGLEISEIQSYDQQAGAFKPMGVNENTAALTRAVEAWNAGNVDAYMELYADSIKLHAGTYDFPSREAVEGMYKGMHAATSDLRLDIHEAFGEGDKLVARYTVTGTHTGDLMGIPATGKQISITGITVMHFEDGTVVERWDSDDSAEALSSLRDSPPD